MNTEFSVLENINKNGSMSQRDLSKKCGMSLGKVNYAINNLHSEGYIDIYKYNNKNRYKVTEKGLQYLEENIRDFNNKKIRLHNEEKRTIKNAVILAAGYKKDFLTPACLLKLNDDDKTMLERNLRILKESGINNIIIVTGYNKEELLNLKNNKEITFVQNDRYKWTGSMSSLACIYDKVHDDFLLIEDDILIEQDAIRKLLEVDKRDCVLITKESGSGDEAFVEVRNGNLYKMSKDIHQFNSIDGEFLGISKISYDVFSKMMSEFMHNKNPYLNYEYILLDVSKNYDIGVLKINDLIWTEVDNQAQYNNMLNKIYPMLKRKEQEYKKQYIKDILRDTLKINEEDVIHIKPFGGMTNKNYKVDLKEKSYVLRLPGNGTSGIINRENEMINATLASKLEIDAAIRYFDKDSGIKISDFIEGAETLNGQTAKKEENMIYVTSILRKLHNSNIRMNNEFDVFKEIEEYEKLLENVNATVYDGYSNVRSNVMELKKVMDDMNITKTPCHNDTVPENFIKGKNKMHLIDWEYSGMNDPMWDIAAHCIECEFDEVSEELFLNLYFECEPTIEIKKRILINKICQDFLWTLWTLLKEAQGDDFKDYGINRYNRAIKNLKLLGEY
ncbi:winged helix-turn-helix transcriptional regulator [Hathewaya histolytica]|uniref:winged helix-turn-helix transcriptional regulator n=1 Tax=Hathewaya histolytica TaxID=1498 RepID=UPI003B66D1FC